MLYLFRVNFIFIYLIKFNFFNETMKLFYKQIKKRNETMKKFKVLFKKFSSKNAECSLFVCTFFFLNLKLL